MKFIRVTKALLFSFLLFSFVSCHNGDNNSTRNQYRVDSSSNVILDTKGRKLNSIFSYRTISNNDYLAIASADSVFVFSMATGKLLNQLAIPKKFLTDTTGDYTLNNICLNKLKDIFFISKKSIIRLKEDSIYETELNFKRKEYLLYNLQNDHPVFDSATNLLYIQKYSTGYSQNDPLFYRTNVLCAVNVNSGKETEINLPYPALYQNNYYGFINQVYFSSNKNSTVISFSASPDFYVFDRSKNILDSVQGKSYFQKRPTKFLPKEAIDSRREKMQHWYLAPEYHETLIDPDNNFIYRFFLNEQPLKKENGDYSAYWDKQVFLMLFDKEHKLIQEIDISKNGYELFYSFPGKNKLFLLKPSDKDVYEFQIIQFKEK